MLVIIPVSAIPCLIGFALAGHEIVKWMMQ